MPGRARFCYEPFSGSGSQIIAGEATGRRVFAIEISPQYVDLALRRWQTATGKHAEAQRRRPQLRRDRRRAAAACGMKQSRRMSLVEAIANVGVGFCVALLTQIIVFPLFGLAVASAKTSRSVDCSRSYARLSA